MAPIVSRDLERTMDDQQGSADDALGANLDKILVGANTPTNNHLLLIRTAFDQLKAKLNRFG